MVILQCKEEQSLDITQNKDQVCVGGKVVEWSMIIQIIEGKDGISHHEFN